jgi:phenylalanyl-tRNA synthetase beta chain
VLAPLSWLRDFAPFDQTIAELAEALSNLGLVVDGVREIGGGLDGVEVVRILDIRQHPNADRIRLVDVDRGDGHALQIACGANNMQTGDLVALATIGTTLPNGMEIARRKMRGEWSNGMLCSPPELGWAEDGAEGLAILPPDVAPLGTPVAEALGITPDAVFDLDITPNRPDALSMAGIARDLAATLGLPFSIPAVPSPVDPGVEAASVVVEAGDLCPRFTGTVLSGVRVGPSPAWLADRLTLAGMRPINNVVDVSNYVMLHLGQPNHAYDLDRLGGRGLTARRARPGEALTTLDGVERALEGDDCVIADAAGAPVGVGGIMGGEATEITDATTTVLLEAAYFSPMAIARTGKRLMLASEARARYERGADPEGALAAVDLFAHLLVETGASELRRGPTTDVRAPMAPPEEIRLRTARVNALLGVELDDATVAGYLHPLGFATTPDGPGAFRVTAPSWRPDVTREIDLVEEVARLYGYRRVTRTVPTGARSSGGLTNHQRRRRELRQVFAGMGLDEAWTTTFLGPGDLERAGLDPAAVEVENPLDRSESLLRTSLLPGLLKTVRFNADHQHPDLRLFEIGRAFGMPSGDAVVPVETETAAVILAGADADARLAARMWAIAAQALRLDDVRLAAGEIPGLHPTRSARIVGTTGTPIGAVGEVDPEVVAAYDLTGRVGWIHLDLVPLFDEPRRPETAPPVSRYPASDFDLAFVVAESVPAAEVERTLRAAAGDLVEGVALFDVYRSEHFGPGRRSLAYRLRLRAPDRTLTEAELTAERRAAIDAVVDTHQAELRG